MVAKQKNTDKPLVGVVMAKYATEPAAHAARINDALRHLRGKEQSYPVVLEILSVSDLTGTAFTRFTLLLKNIWRLGKVCDVIHFTHYPPFFPLLLVLIGGTPYIIGPNITGSAFPKKYLGEKAIEARQVEKSNHFFKRLLTGRMFAESLAYRVSRFAAQVITLSDYATQIVVSRGLVSDRISKLPFGAPYLCKPKTHGSKSDIQSEPLVLAYVGRLDRRKGFDVFLELIRNTELNVRFLVVGDGLLRGQLEELVLSDSRVQWLGEISRVELLKLYGQMDIYFQPSTYEAIATTVLEALRAGVPVVSSDIPAHLELSKFSGIRYFESGDVCGAEEQLSELIANYVQICSMAQQEKNNLDLSKAVDWLVDVYLESAKEPKQKIQQVYNSK